MKRTTITTLSIAALALLMSSGAEAGPRFSGRAALGRRAAQEKVAAEQAAPVDLAGKLQAMRTARSDKDKVKALEAVVEELIAQDQGRLAYRATPMGQGEAGAAMDAMVGMAHGEGMMGTCTASCPMMKAAKVDAGGTPGVAPGATDHAAHHQ